MKRVTSKLLNFLLIVLFLNFSFSECQGDANQDQNLDVLDIVVVVNHVLNFQLLDDQQFNLADINADSVLDILDIVSIVNMILSGELDHLPEQAFYLVGNIDEVKAKAEKMASESKS